MKKIIIYFILFAATFQVCGQQITIETTGTINVSNGFNSLNEAGTDFQSPIYSIGNFYLSVYYRSWLDYIFMPDKKWGINISKSDTWNYPNLQLEVRRTGNGVVQVGWLSTQMPPSNGQTFQEITNNSMYFFEGQHGIANIPLEFRLVGASVTMGAGDFNSTIYFTVYDR